MQLADFKLVRVIRRWHPSFCVLAKPREIIRWIVYIGLQVCEMRFYAKVVSWVEQGLTSHQTHYRSYRGRIFTDQMTQPTVSDHWRKLVPKDQTSIPSGPPHRAHNNTTTMQCETKTLKIQTQIYAQWNGLSVTKPSPQNCKNCSHLCAYHCAQLSYTTQHRAVLIIFPLNLQTSIIYKLRYCLLEGRGTFLRQQTVKHHITDNIIKTSVLHEQQQNVLCHKEFTF